jgi:hypothetical protein
LRPGGAVANRERDRLAVRVARRRRERVGRADDDRGGRSPGDRRRAVPAGRRGHDADVEGRQHRLRLAVRHPYDDTAVHSDVAWRRCSRQLAARGAERRPCRFRIDAEDQRIAVGICRVRFERIRRP